MINCKFTVLRSLSEIDQAPQSAEIELEVIPAVDSRVQLTTADGQLIAGKVKLVSHIIVPGDEFERGKCVHTCEIFLQPK